MPGEWRLTPHAYLACLEADAVFLDLRTETYMCLPDLAGEVACLVGGRATSIAADLAIELADHGLIEPRGGTEPRLRPSIPPPATASALPAHAERLAAGDLPAMLTALLDAGRTYRGKPVTELIAAVQRSRAERRRTPPGDTELSAVVSKFARWLPYAPLPPKCLLRAFLLLRILHRHGLDATWVFGVTTWPFRAHCWLQVGDLVLDDDADRVAGFVPIMAV